MKKYFRRNIISIFSKEQKMWLCKVKTSELKNMLKSLETDADLPGIRFGLLKRKKINKS